MRLRTELVTLDLFRDDATFHFRELNTTELTEVALVANDQPAAMVQETWMRGLVGWDGVQGMDGKPLEFTQANRLAVFLANPETVDGMIIEYHLGIDKAKETQKKILNSGADGS